MAKELISDDEIDEIRTIDELTEAIAIRCVVEGVEL